MSEKVNPLEGSDALAFQGLQFFGAITASVSHELKNVLAVVNENAGLLEDTLRMAASGMELNPERLEKISQRLMRQVQRGDGIIKNLNRFAHGVDEERAQVDVHDLLALTMRLMERLASRREVTLQLEPAAQPVMASIRPFFLQLLLFECLHFLVDARGEGNHVKIRTLDEGSVIVKGVREESQFPEDEKADKARKIASLMDVRLEFGHRPPSFEIHLG